MQSINEELARAVQLWSVVVDCHDPIRVGRRWAEALGWQMTSEAAQEATVEAGDEERPFACVFVPTPEPQVGKDRPHLDLASASYEHRGMCKHSLRMRGCIAVVHVSPYAPAQLWVVHSAQTL
jgi:hypothetical protein